jgi:hypothetical protein
MSQSFYQLYHTCCRYSSVGNIQSNCSKRTCFRSLSAILLCCELCQAVQLHKRYTDRQRLYGHCFDNTEYTAFQNCTQRQGLKLQLDWLLSRTWNVVMEPELISEMCVHLNQLTLLSVCENSIIFYVG